jgi:putative 4-mercaptohistidine N1-methyltranferase
MSTNEEGHHKYESERQVQEYLNLHFGSLDTQLPGMLVASSLALQLAFFPQRCSQLLTQHAQQQHSSMHRALDVGCAVGGSTFELARHFTDVVGIDFSAAFIAAAERLRSSGSLSYSVRTEGEQFSTEPLVARAPADVDAARIRFEVGDACNLDLDRLGQFDAVLAGNLLCRLPDPRRFLADLSRLVAPGGVVLFTSPFSWFAEYTPREHWLGGRAEDAPLSSAAGLVAALSADFDLVSESSIALMIREHHRKFQFITPHVSVFRRKSQSA